MEQEAPVRGWAERFLNAISKFFGFDGYKSASTINWEQGQENVERMKTSLSETVEACVTSKFKKRLSEAVGQESSAELEQELRTENSGPGR